MTALGVFILVVLPWYIKDVYPQLPQEVKDFLKPIEDFATNPLVRILVVIGYYFRFYYKKKK